MIKINYEQESYVCGAVGCQPYDIKTEITLNQDANVTEVLVAVIKILNVAGYRITEESLIEDIKRIFNDDYYL